MSKGKKNYGIKPFAMPITENGFVDAFLGTTDTGNKQRMLARLVAGGYDRNFVARIFQRVIRAPDADKKVSATFRDAMGVWLKKNGFNISLAA